MITIGLSSLTNNNLFALSIRVNEIIKTGNIETMGISLYFNNFETAFNKFKTGIEHQGVSAEELQQADNRRDEILIGFTNHIRNFNYHPNETKKDIAKKLTSKIIKHGKKIYAESYKAETAILTQIIDEFETEHTESMNELNATEWFNFLKEAQENFEQTLRDYTQEKAIDQSTLSASETRADLIVALRKLFAFLPLQAEITQNEELVKIVNQLQIETSRF